MAGRDGARGYVYQALVAVLKCFQTDSWNQIKVEPLTNNDKVDILLKKDEVLIKAIQVKTSNNKFEKPDIERWIDDIKNDVKAIEYELVLIGDYLTKPARELIEENNNDKSTKVYIEVIEGGERGIKKLIKGYLFEFLECYNPSGIISMNDMDDIAKRIFARLVMISTNESFFSRDDLVNEINRNISSHTDQKRRWYSIKKGIFVLVCIFVFFFSIYVSRESLISLVCVIFSDVMIITIWGLLKYSDIYFWRNLTPKKEYFCSREYGSKCRSIAVNIHIDRILCTQKVYIENLLNERIDYIEGVIKFFFGKTLTNEIHFKKIDIDSGREIKVDEIAYNMDRQYSDKTFWDQVELHINNIVSKDSRACAWSGTVIDFIMIPDFDQFNYFWLGQIRILPYEITWFKNNIVNKLSYCITGLMTIRFTGYNKNFMRNIKIKLIGWLKRFVCRLQGVMLLCIVLMALLGLVLGQLFWIVNALKYMF